MKKIICFICFATALFACNQSVEKQAQSDSKPKNELKSANFQLFQTQNMWTFLKLDTRNGRIWQVQYDIQGNNRGEVILSDVKLTKEGEERSGRYTLYPTTNFFNFILLDQDLGKTYQVQWSQEEENRGIVPISQ